MKKERDIYKLSVHKTTVLLKFCSILNIIKKLVTDKTKTGAQKQNSVFMIKITKIDI